MCPSSNTSTNTRWCPTPEQLMILEELYRRGLKTPTATQIQRITAHLSLYGMIQGKNVFYWFQNHKARDRQKLRKKLAKQLHLQNLNQNYLFYPHQTPSPHHHLFYPHLLTHLHAQGSTSTTTTKEEEAPSAAAECNLMMMQSWSRGAAAAADHDVPMESIISSSSRSSFDPHAAMLGVGPTTMYPYYCCTSLSSRSSNKPLQTLDLFPLTPPTAAAPVVDQSSTTTSSSS